MTLERQVCSYELSKRIDALGVKRECLFRYAFYKGKRTPVYINDLRRGTNDPLADFIPAYTVAELGEMLSDGMDMTWKSSTGEWNCRYTLVSHEDNAVGTTATTEADARAKMLIHLIEQGVIDPKKV